MKLVEVSVYYLFLNFHPSINHQHSSSYREKGEKSKRTPKPKKCFASSWFPKLVDGYNIKLMKPMGKGLKNLKNGHLLK